jgi:hypothetical protein
MPNTMTVNRPDWADETESKVKIYFNFTKGYTGTYWEPPEPPETNILKIEDETKINITDVISNKEFEYYENFVNENWESSDWESRVDYLREDRKYE